VRASGPDPGTLERRERRRRVTVERVDTDVNRTLRIAVVAPPMLPIPPAKYAGTERIVAALVDGLHRRGHRVTL
jgi:hypothetical protein